MSTPFISKVEIKNFRNFLNVSVPLSHKQVIIGENNCGKTNFLRALQLILDSSLSDNDRTLRDTDFHDSIVDPLKAGTAIEIAIEIQGYETHSQLLARFQDGVISDDPPTIRINYKFGPVRNATSEIIDYQYILFLGNNEDNPFTPSHRNLINIKVIRALRDVEREMKSLSKSPMYQLIRQFDILDEDLEGIADELKVASNAIMSLDEIIEIKSLVQRRFTSLAGNYPDCGIDLSTFDIDPNRLLYALQILLGNKRRPVSEVSLGLCNILYITLMLLLIRDRTIPKILKASQFEDLTKKDSDEIVRSYYSVSEKGNYVLHEEGMTEEEYSTLYSFMNRNVFPSQTFTILAVEEPEAHLHPALQRMIYREVLHKSESSVIFTTHSTHITSVAPLATLVHVKSNAEQVSNVLSAARLTLSKIERADVERYLDARRSELYFGTGVILVEGISEELLIPRFAELLGFPLDNFRIVVCNINSTNFKPYVQLLEQLQIPWCLITDGDYYEKEDGKKIFHRLLNNKAEFKYLGLENMESTLTELDLVKSEEIDKLDYQQLDEKFQELGCFVGNHTFEVDMMLLQKEAGKDIFKKVFSELRLGRARQQLNFDNSLDAEEYWEILKKIETPGIGKGRFAQRLASHVLEEQIPPYVKQAIKYIKSKVCPDE